MAKNENKSTEEKGPGDTIEDLKKVEECFIITPIGDFNSEIFIKANGLIDSVIQPVLDEFGFKATAAHQINKSGSINNQIIKRILEDKLVIVNLTGLNPNVMYELAIRHAARLPVIIMAEKALTPRLPFDITDQRTIFYSDTLAGNVLAKHQLKDMIKIALDDEKPDNPIYAAASQDKIFQTLDKEDPLKLIMDKIESLANIFAQNSNSRFGSKAIFEPEEQTVYSRVIKCRVDISKYLTSENAHNFKQIIYDVNEIIYKLRIAYPNIEVGTVSFLEDDVLQFPINYDQENDLKIFINQLQKTGFFLRISY